jgi:cyclopropane fatty-acyl-phospholipid synthase-like methyltransferase
MRFKKIPEIDCTGGSEREARTVRKTCAAYETCLKPKLPNKLRSLFRAISRHPKGSVLDVGCGGGAYSCYFAQLGFDVTGIDISEPSIQSAALFAEALELDNVTFKTVDARGFDVGRFDIAYSFDVVEHIPWEHHETFLKGVYKNLKPGGVFYIRAPHSYNIRQYVAGHIGLPTYEELMQAAENTGYKAQVLLGHTGKASPVNYAVALERMIYRVAPNEYWRYTFLKYFSLANVVLKLTK